MARRTQAVFEAYQQGNKLLKLGHIFCRSQQEEDGVKIAFFRHYAIFAQEVSKNRRGYTERFIFAVTCINTGLSATVCKDRQSIDSLHSLQKNASVPRVQTGRSADQPQFALFHTTAGLTIHQFRYERTNMLTVIEDQFAGINAIYHTIHPHITTADTFMHFGVDIQCGKQRIERAGGGVHHKGVVHAFVRYITLLPFDVAVFLWICEV